MTVPAASVHGEREEEEWLGFSQHCWCSGLPWLTWRERGGGCVEETLRDCGVKGEGRPRPPPCLSAGSVPPWPSGTPATDSLPGEGEEEEEVRVNRR